MIRFTVPGAPIGKGRPKFARRGAFVHAYTPAKTVNYENLVKIMAQQAMQGHELFSGSVAVSITLSMQVPASWSQKKRAQALSGQIKPTSKPDLDNAAKAVLDACNAIVFDDDKQVCDMTIRKRYADTPGTDVVVRELTTTGDQP